MKREFPEIEACCYAINQGYRYHSGAGLLAYRILGVRSIGRLVHPVSTGGEVSNRDESNTVEARARDYKSVPVLALSMPRALQWQADRRFHEPCSMELAHQLAYVPSTPRLVGGSL